MPAASERLSEGEHGLHVSAGSDGGEHDAHGQRAYAERTSGVRRRSVESLGGALGSGHHGGVRVSPTWLGLGAALVCSACVAAPTDAREHACDPEATLSSTDPSLGVRVEAASDAFVHCASCEPSCYRAVDTLRSWDVEARGAGGLVFDPSVAGATSPERLVPCETIPCAMTYEYVDGASYSRTYAPYEPVGASPCDALIERSLWGPLVWDATLPPDTSIEIQIRAGGSEPLDPEPVTTLVVTEGTPTPRSVSELLLLAGADGSRAAAPLLQITAVLHPSTDRRHAPVLRELSLEVTCVAGP